MKKPLKIVLAMLAALLLIVLIWAALNPNVVRMLWINWFWSRIPLDQGDWYGGETYEHVAYSDISEATYLDLYVPDGEPKPLFVMIHGGGFFYGDSQTRQAQFMYRYFRDRGYACASVHYRLSSEAQFPAAVDDVKAAVRFLRANADKYGYDADKVVVWGESAGGYLASMVALTNDTQFTGTPFIGEDQLTEPVSAQVDALVNYYGCIDLDKFAEDFQKEGVPAFVWKGGLLGIQWDIHRVDKTKDTFEDMFIGKPTAEFTPEELAVYSPCTYAKENLPETKLPIYILHGDADITVPLNQSRRLAETCEAAGGQVTFEIMPNARHADENMFTNETLARVEAWLKDALNKE